MNVPNSMVIVSSASPYWCKPQARSCSAQNIHGQNGDGLRSTGQFKQAAESASESQAGVHLRDRKDIFALTWNHIFALR